MKLLLGLIFAIFAAVVFAQRPSTTFEPMNWSTMTALRGAIGFQVATKKDLLVYYDASNVPPPPPSSAKRGDIRLDQSVMSVRRRNAEGVYEFVGNFTGIISPFVSTNGRWVAMQFMGLDMALFSVDSNNTISEASYISSDGGYVLSDDTFVGWTFNFAGDQKINTYQYEASNNTWIKIPAAELDVRTRVNAQGEFSTYRVTDTHLVIINVSNSSDIHVQIYSRQADKSWKFVESVPVNNSFAIADSDASVNYNGVDTLIFSTAETNDDGTTGIMHVYNKLNDKWTEQTFTTLSVGYRPQGNFGAVTTFLDPNTLLVTADLEGFNISADGAPDNVGKVLVMTRNSNGMWEPSLDLNNPTGSGLWGAAVGFNDHDIIIPNINIVNGESLTFYTAPRCFMQPINVTCNDQQVSDCSELTISSLYTVNNAQCGNVTTTLNGLGLVNNKAVQAQFSFSRYGTVMMCNATVTCPAPPSVVAQPSSPSKVSSAVVLVRSSLASLVLGFVLLLV